MSLVGIPLVPGTATLVFLKACVQASSLSSWPWDAGGWSRRPVTPELATLVTSLLPLCYTVLISYCIYVPMQWMAAGLPRARDRAELRRRTG
jgi:hypothetical protein